MAWAEQLPSGHYRGGYWIKDGDKKRKRYVSEDENGQPFVRKTDAKEAAEDAAAEARRKAPTTQGNGKTLYRDWWAKLSATRHENKISSSPDIEDGLFRNFFEEKWGDKQLNQIKRTDVQRWVWSLDDGSRKPSYIGRIAGSFTTSMNLAVDEGLLDASPCVKIKLFKNPKKTKKSRRTKRHMTVDYGAAIDAGLHPRVARARRFQHDTGARPGELCGLHADHVDLKNKRVHLQDVYVSKLKVIRPWPKDEDGRWVPLTEAAFTAVEEALDGRDLTAGCGVPHFNGKPCKSVIVFLSPRGKPMTPRNYAQLMTRAAGRQEMDAANGPYTMRRGFATRAKRAGIDLNTIRILMGHAHTDQTLEYIADEEVNEVEFLDKFEGNSGLRAIEGGASRGAQRGAEPHGTTLGDIGPGESSKVS
ncbi:tyrosine-type recombinase/integrase [Amycolatopsis kentuckyensis]|uniref:tyrosine-type recombinase/integrase n=1 Tax=Amycolatopsis kentuckyensis TaxID=218823 RepID=UPI0035657AB0